MEWSIQQTARLAGTTSRTLRHYDQEGLVTPSRTGDNGYRYYGERELLRLQRVLLFRELGLSLPQIRAILHREQDEASALATHLELLKQEQERLARQIAAVEHTMNSLKGREQLVPENMFDGFDHTKYRSEVEERWGKDAYARSDRWWRDLSASEKADFRRNLEQLNSDWIAAFEEGVSPDSGRARELSRRHLEWLRATPGTPVAFGGYVRGLADMYVSDARFAANYGGQEGAGFVRAALLSYLEG